MKETKIIRVSKETYEWLDAHGKVTNSFDSVIRRLIEFYEKNKEKTGE